MAWIMGLCLTARPGNTGFLNVDLLRVYYQGGEVSSAEWRVLPRAIWRVGLRAVWPVSSQASWRWRVMATPVILSVKSHSCWGVRNLIVWRGLPI
jgi:hypothetical protein